MPRNTILRLLAAATAGAILVVLTLATALAAPANDLNAARFASARFNSMGQAERAGYGLPPGGPLHECIASFDNTGAMGFHLINGALLSGDEAGVADAARPEALVYAPDKHGKLKLVALEYVVFADAWTSEDPPSLFGEDFMFTPFPNRYDIPAFWALHAWIWEGNPSGTFAPFNPAVSC
jgi:hypothetical protein